jgi:hypothetical protein
VDSNGDTGVSEENTASIFRAECPEIKVLRKIFKPNKDEVTELFCTFPAHNAGPVSYTGHLVLIG